MAPITSDDSQILKNAYLQARAFTMLGKQVEYVVYEKDGPIITGVCEYITPDCWVGIRLADGTINEAYSRFVREK